MEPLKVEAVVELLVMAPALLYPVPDGIRGSTEEDDKLNPFKSSVAPLLMMVLPAEVPRGPEFPVLERPNLNTPALIVVAPVNVLFPASFQIPTPSFVSEPVVVFKGLVSTPPCAPPIVNPKVAPVMAPVLVKLIDPVSPTMEDAAAKVSVPG